MASVHSVFFAAACAKQLAHEVKAQPVIVEDFLPIVIVASRNITISAALPTCRRKMCREMKYLTEVLVEFHFAEIEEAGIIR